MNSPLAGARVLLVEDERMVAWTLEDVLSAWGCTAVGPVGRVGQALAMLDAEAVDVALLDVSLDGEKSYPVADALATRGVPFAFLTGYGKDSLPSRYAARPMLRKPFTVSALDDALAALLIAKSRAPAGACLLRAQPRLEPLAGLRKRVEQRRDRHGAGSEACLHVPAGR